MIKWTSLPLHFCILEEIKIGWWEGLGMRLCTFLSLCDVVFTGVVVRIQFQIAMAHAQMCVAMA